MATNEIPGWSANLSLNVPKDERELLRRMAGQARCRSLAQFLKEIIAIGVAAKCQTSAAELREIRRRYYGGALLMLFLGALAMSWIDHEELQRGCRRCARRPGLRFEECVTVEMEEV